MNKTFHFQIAVKAVTPQEGGKSVLIQGYASTPDLDRYNDIVEPQAFASALSMFMKNPTLLRSHDADTPCGNVTVARITDQGLWIEALVTEEDTVDDILNNRMRALSIGYIPLESTLQHKDGTPFNAETDSPWDSDMVRVIKKLDLVEISVVSTPANGYALFNIAQSVKSYFKQLALKSMNLKEVDEEKVKATKEGMCPECGKPLDDEGNCPNCDSCKPPTKDAEIETPENTNEPVAPIDEQPEKTNVANDDGKKDETQDGAEKPAETTGAEAEETGEKPGDESGTEAKLEEVVNDSKDEVAGVLEIDEESAKSLPDLVKAGFFTESKSAEALKLPKQIVVLLANLTKAYSVEVKLNGELEAKLAKQPEKLTLKVHGQFEEPKQSEKKPEENSDGFKKLFSEGILKR